MPKRSAEVSGMTLNQRFARVMKKKAPVLSVVKGRVSSSRRTNELKFFDTAISELFDATAEIPATGGQLNLIPQGVTESERVGRRCVIKSIQIVGTIATATAGLPDTVAMWVVLDKQANGAAPTVAQVVTAGSTTTNGLPGGLVNLENSERFVLLKKFVYELTPSYGVVGATGNAAPVSVSWFRKVDIPIEFDSSAATGALTTIRSNNLFLICGSAGNSDDAYNFNGTCRLRFSDN